MRGHNRQTDQIKSRQFGAAVCCSSILCQWSAESSKDISDSPWHDDSRLLAIPASNFRISGSYPHYESFWRLTQICIVVSFWHFHCLTYSSPLYTNLCAMTWRNTCFHPKFLWQSSQSANSLRILATWLGVSSVSNLSGYNSHHELTTAVHKSIKQMNWIYSIYCVYSTKW